MVTLSFNSHSKASRRPYWTEEHTSSTVTIQKSFKLVNFSISYFTYVMMIEAHWINCCRKRSNIFT